MSLARSFLSGFGALFAVTTTPLYRYPYRTNHEGLSGDMGRVAADIESLMQQTGPTKDE